MKKILLIFLTAACVFAQTVACFATNVDEVEGLLSSFQPQKVEGAAFKEMRGNYELIQTQKEKGGIIAFDVAENGNIAIITGERDFLSVYDSNMSIIGQYDPKFQMEGVRYLGDMLLLFGIHEICAVYNAHGELVALYDINIETDDIRPYKEYESLSRECVKRRKEYIYYVSDRKKSPPAIELGKKHQYSYLIREDKMSNRTVLLNRKNYRIITVIIVIAIIISAVFVNLLWINYKYHIFKKRFKKR